MKNHRLSLFAALGSLALGALQPISAAVPDSLYKALDQRVKVLERLRELEQEAATAKAKEAPVVSASKVGFSFRSADSAFRLFAHPFKNSPDSPLKNLGLGLAGTLGNQEGRPCPPTGRRGR